MCTDIKIKDVSGLTISMCLVDIVVHIVIGLNPIYTFALHASRLWCVASIWYVLCFPCTKFRDWAEISNLGHLVIWVSFQESRTRWMDSSLKIGSFGAPCREQLITVGIVNT